MTNSYMTDPAQHREFLLARTTRATSVSLTEAAASVKTGLTRFLFCALPLVALLGASVLFEGSMYGQTVTSFPYNENFEAAPWTTPSTLNPAWSTAANATGGANALWAANNYTAGWSSALGSYTPTGANGTTKSARFHDYDCPSGGVGEFYSPTMDFSSLAGEKAVSFWHINTTGTDVIRVSVSTDNGVTWGANLITLGVSAAWTKYTVGIGNTTSSTVKIKFRADGTFGGSDIGIDEVSVFQYNPTDPAYTFVATAAGGLWSSPATWTGGVVPGQGLANVSIPAGSIVTLDQVTILNTLNVSGVFQWNAIASNTLTSLNNITVNAGGRLINHTTAAAAAAITVGGNFINNGYVNMAIGGSLSLNGSGSCSISGTGTFEGNGADGIIRTLGFTGSGSYSISTTQKLIVNANLNHLGGSLNTNGNLTIDNTVSLFGRPINTQAANVAVNTMGSAYTSDPVVASSTSTQWTSGAAGTANSRYFNAGNIYLLTSGTTQGTVAPTHTSGAANNFLWLCSSGSLGNLYLGGQSHTAGTQYIYGNNLYLCTVTGNGSATAGPTHTSGALAVGAATFLYVGPAIKVSVNRDATTSTIRSLNLVNVGSGYASAPAITFSGGGGSGAAAVVVVNQSTPGVAFAIVQKSGEATVTGGITINSDAGATAAAPTIPQSSSGVGSVYCTAGGANYSVAPQLGFSPPTALNLVTAGGSGYTSAPTITVTGGTQPAGAAALVTGDFTITVNQGKVVSVYVNTTVTKTYITPPTLAFTGGGGAGATLAFPANCWPAATASIGSNTQITSISVTNKGYGYVTAPSVAVGNASGTATGGTYTTAASGFTARVAAYYLRTAFFTGANNPGTQLDDAYIPANRKMHALWLNGNDNGIKLTGNLTLISAGTGTTASTATAPTPLILTASNSSAATAGQQGNVLDMGGNNLYCSWNGFAGTSSTAGTTIAYLRNGSMTLTTRGGGTTGSTLNFPFLGNAATGRFQVQTGTGTGVTNGADILTVKVTELGAPTNTGTPVGTGLALGNRSYSVETTTIGGGAGTAGTNPQIRLNWNNGTFNGVTDNVTTTQDQTFVGEAAAGSGPWTVRSAAAGASGALAATGEVITANVAPGPITLTSGNRYAWATATPAITYVSKAGLSMCAISDSLSIYGTNLTGTTGVFIGGTAVASFTVVSNTRIDAYAGNGTTGVVSIVKNGATITGTGTVTVNASPAAPSLSQSSYTGSFGSTQSITATGTGGTISWYTQAFGGTAVFNGATYNVPACATGSNYWAAESSGGCEGSRSQVSVTVSPAIAASASPTFICANNTPVSLSTNVTGATYNWTTTQGSFSSATAATPTLNNLTYTAEVNASITKNGCVAAVPQFSVGVYSFPSGIAPTATPSTLCNGTTTTLATGLSAGNFTAVCATPAVGLSTPPAGVTATTLILNGAAQTLPSGVSWSSSLDDGKFGPVPMGFNFNFFGNTQTAVNIGTNGVVNFGTYASFSGSQYIFTGGFPAAGNPASTIAVCARDLRFGTPAGYGSLRYWTEGTAPNRRFIVQYDNVPIWSGVVTTAPQSGFQSAEAVFYETLGQIDIRVISATNGTSTTAAEINKYIGLQDATKTIGATAPNCSSPFQQNYWNGISNAIASPLTWSFIPPKNYTYNWTNTANTTVGNAGSGQLSGAGTGLASPTSVTTTSTAQSPTASLTYQVYIADPLSSCSNVYNVPVTVNPLPAAPTTSYGSSTPLVMCGTQVPNLGGALVSCPTCTGSQTYNWYTAASAGSLFQGSISENFDSGVNPGTFNLYNATGVVASPTGTNQAQLLNTRCELTQSVASQYGALQLGSTGVNTNAYEIDFDLRVDLPDNSGGADGMSYSFGDNVVATQEATMNAENGTGNKLKVAFVSYTNGSSPAGIYLMYNCTTNEQTTATAGVLAYSNNLSWRNTSSDVHVDISIDALGQVTLLLNGVAPTASVGTFSGAQLPAAYLAENKATWQHVFKARTGAAYARCSVDNVIVVSQPAQAFPGIVQPISTSTSYYVQTLQNGCGSATRTEVALQVDAPPAFAITPSATICPFVYTPITVTTGTSSYTQFTWEPVVGGYLFNDAAGTQPYTGDSRTTVYLYSASQSTTLPNVVCSALDTNGPAGNQCANVASSTFTTSTVPSAPVITASSLAPCNNTTITLSAAAAVNYSTPAASSPLGDEDLGQVRIGQLGVTVFDNVTPTNSLVGSIGTATGTAGSYSNFTGIATYTLNAANPVQFQLQIVDATPASPYSNSVAIFIDYNQDGDFADAGETAFNEGATTSGERSVSNQFTIPASALNGLTRMRVLVNEGLITSSTQSVTWGEWEDYAINITGAVSYTYAWTGGIAATTISVTSNPITAPVSFSATVSQGACYSQPSNVLNIAPASAPTVAPTAVAFSAGYSTPTVSSPTFDEDVDFVRLSVDVDGDGAITTAANGGVDYNVFANTSSINSLVGTIGVASGTAGGYANYTAYGPYTLDATYQHRLSIRSVDEAGGWSQALAAWIDYNQDGDFIDAGEQIINGATQTVPHSRNAFFTVPVNAKNGVTRLRVLCNEGTIAGPTQSVFYGEWEDYALNVTNATPAVPCPGSTALLNSGVVGGGLPYASYAWTVNSGTATLTSASAAAPSATVNADAAFSITLTDACGLTASGTTSVFNIAENPVAVTPVDPTVCGNPGTTFTATGGANYSWTPNDATAFLNTSTGDVVIASPTSTKTYTVSGEYGAGCIGTASTTLNYTTPPTVTITNDGPDQDINCGYGPVYQSTLHATSSATYTYTWANGSGYSAADVFTPGANGFLDAADDSSFVVTLTAQEVGGSGCYNVLQRSVSVFPLPDPVMTATPAVIQLGATSVLASGVTQGNFSVSSCPPGAGSISYNRITPPVTAVTLASGGVAVTPQTTASLDDGGWGAVPIGFTYNFFGTNYTTINVGTNGVVQFGTYNAAALQDFTFSNPLPTPLEPTNIIALCAVDLYLATSGTVKYWVDGVAPNRKFVLDFFQVPGYTTNGSQTVQLQLNETTGIFEIHLGQATSTSAKTIGVNNATGTIGAVAPRCEGGFWNSQTGSTGPGVQRAWRFSPPVDYTFAWSPAGQISGVTNLGSATALPTAAGIQGYQLSITDNVSNCSNAANPDSVFVTVLPVPSAPDVVGYGQLSNVDGTNTFAFCGEQDVEAYVPAGLYPATQYGTALTYEVRWYTQAVGGTPLATALGDTIVYGFLNDPAGLTSDDTLYVSVWNGYGESTRSQLVIDYVAPAAISIANSSPLNCGPNSITYTSTLTASSSNASYVYNWSPAGNLDVTTGSTVVATFNNTLNVTLNANDGYCYSTLVEPISRYDFPVVTPTAASDSVCPGGTTTLNSNTSSSNFTISSIGYSPASGGSPVTLVNNAVDVIPVTTGSLDDGLWENIPIGFNFDFLGNTYSTCAISTNGNVQFGTNLSTSYTPSFGAATPNNFVALFWTDLNFNNAGGNLIEYKTIGVAPNRVFSVKMDATRFGEPTKRLRGQIDFFETTGVIEVNIQDAAQGVSGSAAFDVTIVGAENIDGTIGAAVPTRDGTTPWTVTVPEAWKFSPPVNYTFAWSPSGQISGSTTGATATAAPTANTTYQLIVTDNTTGCDNSINQQAFVSVAIASAPPATNFVADDVTPTTGNVPQIVNFTTTTPEFGPSTYAWTFTPSTVTYVGGTSATSRNPQVQFEEPGSYSVSLNMNTCTGDSTRTRNGYIDVTAVYCNPAFGAGDAFTGCQVGYGLGNVVILNPAGVTIMSHSNTGCIGSATLGYADYSASPVNGTTTCTMYQGTTYSMNATSLNPSNAQFFAAYLDVDNDGDFNDPLEFLGNNSVASATSTFNIGIPTSNVTYGLHKMRVIGSFGAGVLNASSSCLVTTYGEAHDYVVNIQPPVILNDIPAFATNVVWSTNQSYPNSSTYSGNTSLATNSPESVSTANDIWYRFTAVGVGVSITMTSSTMDDRITLYSRNAAGAYVMIADENLSSGAGDFERLNVGGLTPGQQYWVSFGAANAGEAGAFTFSISHLRQSWCNQTIPAGGFALCQSFKAVFRGGASDGVTYGFNFFGTGSTPVGPTSATAPNTQIVLSNPLLGLRYGGTYDVRVDVTYTIPTGDQTPGAAPDVIVATGATTLPNCTGVSIIAQPLVEVRSSQRCNAALLRSTVLSAVPVNPLLPVCAQIRYEFEFTAVTGGCGGSVVGGLPVVYQTIAASPYLKLNVLPLGVTQGAWDVRIRPVFSYGNGVYGPTQRILVNSTANGITIEEIDADQDVKEESFIAANLYPNPNNGEMVNLNVSGIESDNVFVRITDAMGRIVYTNRFSVEGSLNQIVTFAEPLASGIYNVEFTVDGEIMTERMIVAKQ